MDFYPPSSKFIPKNVKSKKGSVPQSFSLFKLSKFKISKSQLSSLHPHRFIFSFIFSRSSGVIFAILSSIFCFQ